MKRAVITGATGAVGTALLQELIENNVEEQLVAEKVRASQQQNPG